MCFKGNCEDLFLLIVYGMGGTIVSFVVQDRLKGWEVYRGQS